MFIAGAGAGENMGIEPGGGAIIGARPIMGGHPPGPQPAPDRAGQTASQLTTPMTPTRVERASMRMMRFSQERRVLGRSRDGLNEWGRDRYPNGFPGPRAVVWLAGCRVPRQAGGTIAEAPARGKSRFTAKGGNAQFTNEGIQITTGRTDSMLLLSPAIAKHPVRARAPARGHRLPLAGAGARTTIRLIAAWSLSLASGCACQNCP